ncbi:MAG: alpha/beta fold hydrolase, partial [Nitrospirae bacterium]|nr:alpha/beta fold hydrolase [Nitrospirota bacterium]
MTLSLDSYPEVSRKTIPAAGFHLAYLEAGAGPPLLLIHGFGGGSIAWEHQIPALARRFRVFAPDLPGH